MRQIKIIKIGNPAKNSHYMKQNMYSVYLGNGVTEYFSSIKMAKNFLAKTNKFLNSKLHELNYIYTLLFSEYRRVWFYLSIESEINFCNEMVSIDKMFNNCINKCHYSNGNVYTINYLSNLSNKIAILLEDIKKVMIYKKIYVDVQRIDIYVRNTYNIRNEILNYSK